MVMDGRVRIADYEQKAQNILHVLVNIPTFSSSPSGVNERDLLIEALFLRLVVEVESTLDEVFWEMLVGAYNLDASSQLLHTFPSKECAQIIVLRGKYIQWLPADGVASTTAPFFLEGNPFARIPKNIKHDLFVIHKIRNFIAHRSSSSLKSLGLVISSAMAPVDADDTISRYLLSRHSEAQSKFQYYADILNEWLSSVLV
jgi:hypothetical protein